MNIVEVNARTPLLTRRLLELWEKTVRETHLFLSESDLKALKTYVPRALETIPRLIVAEKDDGSPAAFMGIDGRKLEMLFVASEERGKGLGQTLLSYAIEAHAVDEVTVNEQNPRARAFYERMGFCVRRRSELDEQGNPFPLLYMQRD